MIEKKYLSIITNNSNEVICGYGTGLNTINNRTHIQVEGPEKTMYEILRYAKSVMKDVSIAAIGVGLIGPIDIDPKSVTYGYITSSVDSAWSYFDFIGTLKRELGLPLCFDTVCNAGALGEYRWGAADGLTDFIYMTVGDSIDVGVFVNNKLVRGMCSPQMGHTFVPQNTQLDSFSGICPFHNNCLQGLASLPAMQQRWKVDSLEELLLVHEAWELEAKYIARSLANFVMTISPTLIIIGGDIIQYKHILPMIRAKMIKYLNGLIAHPSIMQNIDKYIVTPQLGFDSGLRGALALAEKGYIEYNVGLKQEFIYDNK